MPNNTWRINAEGLDSDTIVTEYIDICFSMFVCMYGCVEGVGVAKKASISTYSSNNFIYIQLCTRNIIGMLSMLFINTKSPFFFLIPVVMLHYIQASTLSLTLMQLQGGIDGYKDEKRQFWILIPVWRRGGQVK